MNGDSINLGVVGAGGFAQFAVNEFVKINGVNARGVFDSNRHNAEQFCSMHPGAMVSDSFEALLRDPKIDLVYIATPPNLHYLQSKEALLNGKHVICEKPAATRIEHAQELSDLSVSKSLLYVVNLMQRYNPLYTSVQELIRQKVLGEFLHGYFENYASDEFLTKQHWFWNENQSGGIFVEHSVHFFDMFNGWLGQGSFVCSQKLARPTYTDVWDRVQATVMYNGGLVNFYHGFDQPKIMDRQELRLQFEKGDVTLFDWVPTKMYLNAIGTDVDVKALENIFPQTIRQTEETFTSDKIVKARFKNIPVHHRIKMWTESPAEKSTVYKDLVQNMFKDQLLWLKDRNHRRVIDNSNAVSSLRLAVEAENKAVYLTD